MGIRVVYIPDVPEYGGAYNSFCEMVSTLARDYNVEPVILTSRKGKYNEFADSIGAPNYVIGHRPFLIAKGTTIETKIIKCFLLAFYYCWYKFSLPTGIGKAEKYVDFSNVDLIHSNVNRIDIGAILAMRNNVPHVWHLRELAEKDGFYSLRKNYINFMNDSKSEFIAISETVKREWISKGIDKEKVCRIYNGIDNERFWHDRIAHDQSIVRIVMVGRICKLKGQKLLLDALATLPDRYIQKLRVDFYGSAEGTYRKKMSRLAKEKGLERYVSFYPYDERIHDILPKYDIGAMCSKNEGFGRVTAEYMLSGLCVVATKTGANEELVQDYETGLIIHDNSPAECAAILQKLVDNRDLIDKLGMQAQKYAIEHFTKDVNAKLVNDLYIRELGER